MAICKQCTRDISPNAVTCPHCGDPDPVYHVSKNPNKEGCGDKIGKVGCGCLLIFMALFILGYLEKAGF